MSYKGKLKSRLHEVAEGYDLYAASYEKDHAYLDTFEHDVIFKMLGNLKGKKVLDVGCGAGRMIKFLKNAGAAVTAVDISEEMLKIVRKKFPDVEALKADVRDLPFGRNGERAGGKRLLIDDGKTDGWQFDIIVAAFVIVHLDTLGKAFEEIYRVLKDGGIFIVTNVNQRKPPKLKTKDGETIVIKSAYHRPKDVITALEENLFKIEKEEFIYADGVWVNQVIKARK
ncbi:class I SAM-dependent methyltransferase [Candidatus Peregrinibacteria bacterium]|nr:class I SAM-dependent methyltransferase [Candidatus Peregrinibacteria bacterium]